MTDSHSPPPFTIELAPHNKQGLSLHSPLLAGSGAVGYGDLWPPGVEPELFGALITGPVSMQPRKGKDQPRWAELPAGFLFDTGEHNPGWRRTVKQYASVWQRSLIPVIVSLVGGEPGTRAWMAERLEEAELGVAGLELPVPEDINLGEISAFISAVRHATTLPILVRLPATRAAYLAEACVIAGADALIVGSPPPAAYPAADGSLLEAPLAGPIALPFTLRALRRVAALALETPLIAAGGIQTLADVVQCLDLGANAVQVRSLLWVDPAAAQTLASEAAKLNLTESGRLTPDPSGEE
ncbi:MAG: hypothetical protein GXP38_01380 [Chloroflexi bacterium]|nr:hypothetical protein [Chloroflexota bacterium]